MPGIALTGLASGMDTGSLISQLMSIERNGRVKHTLEQAATQARKDGLSSITSKLNSLKFAAADLRGVGLWTDTQTVESNDTTKVAARRTGGAGPGGYEVTVTKLASAERVTYGFPTGELAADTELDILDKDGNSRLKIALTAGQTIEDAVAAINAKPEGGIYAVKVGDDLVLAARTTGEGSSFSVTGDGLTEKARVAGADAEGFVGDVAFKKPSNVLTDVIPGLELTLKGRTAVGEPVALNVSAPKPDPEQVKAKVKAFVDKYNEVVTSIRGATTEKRVANAATNTDAAKGALFGDSNLRQVLSDLRQLVSTSGFAELGVSTGSTSGTINQDSVNGKLTFDEAKLTAAIDKDPVAVQRKLGGIVGVDGIGQRFEKLIEPISRADGTLADRVKATDAQLTRIKDVLTKFDERLEAKEERYRKQFTALELALQRSQSIQSDLAARLSAMGL